MPRADKARKLSPWESYFETVVNDALGFLVSEHGFARGELRQLGYEFYLEFVRAPVAVEIGLGSDLPFTFVKHQHRGVWHKHNLSSLVRGPLDAYYAELPRGPFASKPGTQKHRDAIRRWLNVDANLLRIYGQLFLSGDPSQLEAADRGKPKGKQERIARNAAELDQTQASMPTSP
jgi:hypothetical protein